MSELKSADVLSMVAEEMQFIPKDPQIRAKSAFWTRFSENPICDPSQVSLAVVMQVVGDGRLQRWWGQAGFREWFCNTNEFRERLESLAYKALNRLESIIDLPTEPKIASAQVNAIKLLMEIGRKMPPRNAREPQYLDEKINKMSKQELEDYIEKHTKLLPQVIP